MASEVGLGAADSRYQDIPSPFLCPISMELMKDPMVNEAGQTYDRESIVGWYAAGNRIDPLTQKPIENVQLFPNQHVKSAIEEWKQKCLEAKRQPMEREGLPLDYKVYAKDIHEGKGKGKGAGLGSKPQPVKAKEKEETVDLKQWDEKQVSHFIRSFGGSACWERYSKLCIKREIDAVTLLGTDEDALVELGFNRFHLAAILRELRKLAGVVDAFPLLPADVKMLNQFNGHLTLIEACEEKAREAPLSIEAQETAGAQQV